MVQKNEMSRRHYLPTPYWLIVRREVSEIEVLTVDLVRETTLPVFSFAEEAAMYLRLANLGREWRIRKSTSGELVSMLFGPCADVRLVALDPLPGLFSRVSIKLVSMSSERFVDHFAEKAQPLAI